VILVGGFAVTLIWAILRAYKSDKIDKILTKLCDSMFKVKLDNFI